jgi:hypothetical protein
MSAKNRIIFAINYISNNKECKVPKNLSGNSISYSNVDLHIFNPGFKFLFLASKGNKFSPPRFKNLCN